MAGLNRYPAPGSWVDPFAPRPLAAPVMAETMYVGEYVNLSGNLAPGVAGRYEIVHRTPLALGLRLEIRRVDDSSTSS